VVEEVDVAEVARLWMLGRLLFPAEAQRGCCFLSACYVRGTNIDTVMFAERTSTLCGKKTAHHDITVATTAKLQFVAQRTKVTTIQRTEANREFQQEQTEQAE
jgi:hypothetical protein